MKNKSVVAEDKVVLTVANPADDKTMSRPKQIPADTASLVPFSKKC